MTTGTCMNDPVTLRPLRRDDYPALAGMLRRMWYADPATSEACARRLATIDLHHCLSCSTIATVAECGGEVVGMILARVDADASFGRSTPLNRHVRRVMYEALPLPFSAEGRRGIRDALNMVAVDARLMRGLTGRYDAEIVLFLVDERQRGRGVGRALFDHVMRRFRAGGVRRYFLFTDTTCDVGFYDHRGLTRVREEATSHVDGTSDTYYLVEGEAQKRRTRLEDADGRRRRRSSGEYDHALGRRLPARTCDPYRREC
ncbi:acetyl transferase [Bifidobacterium sp. DSM 109958]|uniref:Acetyl transferase n=1 Tax=Bifidobacterium moraviense TaxID=2675323 RepID=A0A7Y0HYQ4_9BIFI|nr:GNAT family N-acetyltransferase [Bifidobacterium sp. DSM 109958]NMM99993.1 acetyl transferase [Bifidobacterium sp. DSM 109958]